MPPGGRSPRSAAPAAPKAGRTRTALAGDRLGHLAWPSSRPARAKRSRSRPAQRRNPPHLQRFHRHGSWLNAKRLEEGGFRWPKVEDGVVRLTAAEPQALLKGLDWTRVHAPRQVTVPVAAS